MLDVFVEPFGDPKRGIAITPLCSVTVTSFLGQGERGGLGGAALRAR